MTILFHSINGIGLGHLNRSITIAKSIKSIDEEKDIKIITNSKCKEMLNESGFNYLQLDNSDHYDLLSEESLEKFLKEIRELKPSAIVFDTDYPRRLLNHPELSSTTCILVMRKSKKTEIRKMFNEASIDLFEKIIIAHDKEEFLKDIGNDLSFLKRFENKIIYAGLIRKESTEESEKDTISRYNLAKNRTVTLISGSGSEFYHNKEYTKKIEEIFLKHFGSNRNIQLIDVLGPYSTREEKHDDKIIRVRYEKDMPSLLKNSKIIISRAGYNSINEIISSQRPAIIFPGKADEDEQEKRAEFFSNKYKQLHYMESIDEERIIEIINKSLNHKNNHKPEYKLKNGNIIAAQVIIDAITENKIDKNLKYKILADKESIKKSLLKPHSLNQKELVAFPENEIFKTNKEYVKFLINILKDIEHTKKELIEKRIPDYKYNIKKTVDRAIMLLEAKKIIVKKTAIMLKEITLAITSECNLKCKMCDFWKRKEKARLSISNIKKVLKSKSASTIKDIAITGGEPFLRDDINEIFETIRNLKPCADIDMSTNGILTDQIISFFRENIKNPPRIIISIDGIEQHDIQRGISGSLEKSIDTIKKLKELSSHIDITIKMTITDTNYTEIEKVYKLSKELSVSFELKPVENNYSYTNKTKAINTTFSTEKIDIIKEQTNKIMDDMKSRGIDTSFIERIVPFLHNNTDFNCNCPERNTIILPSGDVYSCLHKKRIGNIKDQEFDDIVHSKINQKIILETKKNKCSKCLSYHGSAKNIID